MSIRHTITYTVKRENWNGDKYLREERTTLYRDRPLTNAGAARILRRENPLVVDVSRIELASEN